MMFKIAFASAFACGAAIASADWDYNADFSIANGNPNGAWSYGYESSLNDTFNLYDATVDSGQTGIDAWHSTVVYSLGAPAAFKNYGSSAVNGIGPGEAGLHPGPNNEISFARWTAPSDMTIHITGSFGAGDQGAVDIYVLQNGVIQMDSTNTTVDVPFDIVTTVKKGDKIDFGVGSAGSYFYDSTPLDAHISSVPEPASLAALSFGALALLRRRKKN